MMLNKKHIFSCFLFVSLIMDITVIFANGLYLSLQSGISEFNKPKSTEETITVPGGSNRYVTTKTKPRRGIYQATVGYELTLSNAFLLRSGLNILYAPNYEYKGDIFEAGLPEKGATYSENVTNLSTFINETLVLKKWKVVHPFFGILLGYGRNKTKYQRHNEPGVLSPALFTNKIKENVVYGTILGVNFTVNQHIELGIAYQYMSLGNVALESNNNINPQSFGEIKPLTSQAVLANITYTV